MKNEGAIIFKLVKTVEVDRPDVIAFGYIERDLGKRNLWWVVAVSDYSYYQSPEFNARRKAWNLLTSKLGMKVIFAFRKPTEEILTKLSEQNNLVLNL